MLIIRKYLLYLIETKCYCNYNKETVCGSDGYFQVIGNCYEDDECTLATNVEDAVEEADMLTLCTTPKGKFQCHDKVNLNTRS